ncbi:tRNA pseudouridine(38-40) synthase TruA [Helicobacter bizzozeronii]|uniref:tRNA pseudouridine(38-40) synthase TruA n=1 Tax=Helicobacter bizzozeronii TaxID=56877 RepID=UPI000CF112DA|nr:tRNA pseudouridine(38-40) synthase TruA [Helicobacter bizzozeronii]
MQRFKVVLAYDGSAFCGFAKQEGLPSVEGKLEQALLSLGIASPILAAGRTDRGVHASHQVISFATHLPIDCAKLAHYLPAKLAPHIVCQAISPAPLDFHPRFWALKRTYRYVLAPKVPNPFLTRYITPHPHGSLHDLQKALDLFVGTHDFGYFCKQGSDPKSTIRTIYKASCYGHAICNLPCVVVVVEANAFLRAQVRLMVGAALACSLGKMSLSDLSDQIGLKRHIHHMPLAPEGLILSRVFYGDSLSKFQL